MAYTANMPWTRIGRVPPTASSVGPWNRRKGTRAVSETAKHTIGLGRTLNRKPHIMNGRKPNKN
jgi:hypothetical protein